jgi:hypothetical protein
VPDIIVDGRTKAQFVPTIASALLIPTAIEVNAGTPLEQLLIAAGLEGFEASTAEVDNTSLASTTDTNLPGRAAYSGTGLVLKKQSGTDTVWTTLTTFGTTGFIVIRDDLPATVAFAAGQKVAVYPIVTGQWTYIGRGDKNSMLRYRVPTPISLAPNLAATLT